jgi:hypothetical protein
VVDLNLSDLSFILEKSHQFLDLVVVLWDILDEYTIFSFSLRTMLLLFVHLIVALRVIHWHFGVCVIGGWGRWREIHFTFRTWRWWRRNEVLASEKQRSRKDSL